MLMTAQRGAAVGRGLRLPTLSWFRSGNSFYPGAVMQCNNKHYINNNDFQTTCPMNSDNIDMVVMRQLMVSDAGDALLCLTDLPQK